MQFLQQSFCPYSYINSLCSYVGQILKHTSFFFQPKNLSFPMSCINIALFVSFILQGSSNVWFTYFSGFLFLLLFYSCFLYAQYQPQQSIIHRAIILDNFYCFMNLYVVPRYEYFRIFFFHVLLLFSK